MISSKLLPIRSGPNSELEIWMAAENTKILGTCLFVTMLFAFVLTSLPFSTNILLYGVKKRMSYGISIQFILYLYFKSDLQFSKSQRWPLNRVSTIPRICNKYAKRNNS